MSAERARAVQELRQHLEALAAPLADLIDALPETTGNDEAALALAEARTSMSAAEGWMIQAEERLDPEGAAARAAAEALVRQGMARSVDG